MKRKRFTDEQIAIALRQGEATRRLRMCATDRGERGELLPGKEVRKAQAPEIRELRQLRDENARVTRLVRTSSC
jgi:hypothetical protein